MYKYLNTSSWFPCLKKCYLIMAARKYLANFLFSVIFPALVKPGKTPNVSLLIQKEKFLLFMQVVSVSVRNLPAALIPNQVNRWRRSLYSRIPIMVPCRQDLTRHLRFPSNVSVWHMIVAQKSTHMPKTNANVTPPRAQNSGHVSSPCFTTIDSRD